MWSPRLLFSMQMPIFKLSYYTPLDPHQTFYWLFSISDNFFKLYNFVFVKIVNGRKKKTHVLICGVKFPLPNMSFPQKVYVTKK